MRLRWTLIAVLACAGCAADVASRGPAQPAAAPAAADEPLVGRLKMRARTVDLTASSFGPGRSDVPREATASQVMADIDPERRPDSAFERGSQDVTR